MVDHDHLVKTMTAVIFILFNSKALSKVLCLIAKTNIMWQRYSWFMLKLKVIVNIQEFQEILLWIFFYQNKGKKLQQQIKLCIQTVTDFFILCYLYLP